MRVLVTRPRHQSEQLIMALEDNGHNADLLPLLAIAPSTFSVVEHQDIIEKLRHANKLIAVSANAAALALPFIEECNFDSNPCLYSIGPSTSKVLEDRGYQVQIPEGEYNSESLLELPGFSQIENQKIVILCGKGGRDYLEQQLLERGAHIQRIELYERSPIPKHEIEISKLGDPFPIPDVLTAMSGDTVEALNRFLIDSELADWKKLPLIVPGKRVASIAFEKGFTKVHCSKKPTTESLLDVLVDLE